MAERTIDELERARRDKLLATFTQPGLDGSDWGYVLDIGPRFFLLAHLDVDSGMRFTGFTCFRFADIRDPQVPGKQAAFAEAVLRKRGERLPEKPPVSLASMEELLLTVHRAAPLVAIYREKKSPNECKIGGVLDVRKGRLSLLEIDMDARWEDQPTECRVSEITRVDFGGGYHEALFLVGGPCPRPTVGHEEPSA